MSAFVKDAILFRFLADSKVELPRSSNEAKLYIDQDGVLKVLYFDGSTQIFGQAPQQQTIEVYDDRFLKKQLSELRSSLAQYVTSEQLASNSTILLDAVESRTSDLLASVQATLSRLDATTAGILQLQDFIGQLAESLGNLSKNVLSNNIVFESKLEETRKVLASEIAKLRGELPEVVAGSDNVSVTRQNNTFIVSVEETERVIEKVIEKSGGGGISANKVLKLIEEALKDFVAPADINIVGTGGITVSLSGSTYYIDGSQISGSGSSISTLTSIDGSVIITPISGGYDLSATPAIISGGSTILFGEVSLNDIDHEYTVTHIAVDPLVSVPVVSIESASNFYMYRIFDRSATSFKVALNAVSDIGDKILWHLATGGAEIGNFLVTNDGDYLVDDLGNTLTYG